MTTIALAVDRDGPQHRPGVDRDGLTARLLANCLPATRRLTVRLLAALGRLRHRLRERGARIDGAVRRLDELGLPEVNSCC